MSQRTIFKVTPADPTNQGGLLWVLGAALLSETLRNLTNAKRLLFPTGNAYNSRSPDQPDRLRDLSINIYTQRAAVEETEQMFLALEFAKLPRDVSFNVFAGSKKIGDLKMKKGDTKHVYTFAKTVKTFDLYFFPTHASGVTLEFISAELFVI